MKPFKTYFGGKEASGTYQMIINHIIKHEKYYEPFGGNYTIARKINDTAKKYINECDRKIFQKYKDHDRFTFSNLDYKHFLLSHDFNKKSFIYFDPPYLVDTRRDKRDRYGKELKAYSEHDQLLKIIKQLAKNTNILISHYPCELYDHALKNFNSVTFNTQTRQGPVTEKLYFNYEINSLQDYSFLGKNNLDRQRIKRRSTLLIKKINNLPQLEKLKLLQELTAVNT